MPDRALKEVREEGKTDRAPRSLRLGLHFLEAIAYLMPQEPSEFLFANDDYRAHRRGKTLACWTAAVRRRLQNACRRTGIRYRHPHMLRHYVAAQLLVRGNHEMQIAKWMGHKDDTMIRALYAAWRVQDAHERTAQDAVGLLGRFGSVQPRDEE